MRSPRYTILIANRRTGAVRRLSLSRRLLGGMVVSLVLLVVVAAIGSQGANFGELEALRAANENLLQENESYREATGELTAQITGLQTALEELGDQDQLDPNTRRALENLRKAGWRAAGGPSAADLVKIPTPGAETPSGTFGILRDILGALENRLESVKSRIESQKATAQATPSIWPMVGRWTLSSAYGRRRDPFTGEPDFHPGIDISANTGVPVRATADGTVESAAYDGNYGNAVVLTHGLGLGTRYGHLSRFAVRAGQKVKRGDVVGYVGQTGRATNPHLHYEILLHGNRINPLNILAR